MGVMTKPLPQGFFPMGVSTSALRRFHLRNEHVTCIVGNFPKQILVGCPAGSYSLILTMLVNGFNMI